MDDILSGADTLTAAKELQLQLISLLEKGCMHLSCNFKIQKIKTDIIEF